MLGLGASHLAVLSGADYEQAALRHRVTAMTALNEHMKKPKYTRADADAAFAAMLNLTFQAAYMADGLTDFLTLVRGCESLIISIISVTKAHAVGKALSSETPCFPVLKTRLLKPSPELPTSRNCASSSGVVERPNHWMQPLQRNSVTA